MKDLEKYDEDRLLDLLEETRKKLNTERRKIGLNKVKHKILAIFRAANSEGLASNRVYDDADFNEIVTDLCLTYRDSDEERYRILDRVIEGYENRISNSKYKIEQLRDTIKIITEKLDEIKHKKLKDDGDD